MTISHKKVEGSLVLEILTNLQYPSMDFLSTKIKKSKKSNKKVSTKTDIHRLLRGILLSFV